MISAEELARDKAHIASHSAATHTRDIAAKYIAEVELLQAELLHLTRVHEECRDTASAVHKDLLAENRQKDAEIARLKALFSASDPTPALESAYEAAYCPATQNASAAVQATYDEATRPILSSLPTLPGEAPKP